MGPSTILIVYEFTCWHNGFKNEKYEDFLHQKMVYWTVFRKLFEKPN